MNYVQSSQGIKKPANCLQTSPTDTAGTCRSGNVQRDIIALQHPSEGQHSAVLGRKVLIQLVDWKVEY